MHPRLLSGANTNGLSIHDITNRIRLSELEGDPGNEHIANRRFWQVLALCNDLCKVIPRHGTVVVTLFQAHAEDLTGFRKLRFVAAMLLLLL